VKAGAAYQNAMFAPYGALKAAAVYLAAMAKRDIDPFASSASSQCLATLDASRCANEMKRKGGGEGDAVRASNMPGGAA